MYYTKIVNGEICSDLTKGLKFSKKVQNFKKFTILKKFKISKKYKILQNKFKT